MLKWIKPRTPTAAQNETEGDEQPTTSRRLSESQDTSHGYTPSHSGETDNDECLGYSTSFTSSSGSDESHHHTIPPQPNQPKLKFPSVLLVNKKGVFPIHGTKPCSPA